MIRKCLSMCLSLHVSWRMRKLLERDCNCACVSVYTTVSNESTEANHGLLRQIRPFLHPLQFSEGPYVHTVIRFLWVSAKFSTCTVVRVNGTLVEDKMRRFKGECEHFRFNKCPIYTHDGAGAKLSTNSQEMDNSAMGLSPLYFCVYNVGWKLFVIRFLPIVYGPSPRHAKSCEKAL